MRRIVPTFPHNGPHGFLLRAGLLGAALFPLLLHAESGTAKVDFNKDVRPVLSNRCFKCHGPDDQTREGGLRLDDASSHRPAKSGAIAVIPGNPEESELLARLNSHDPTEQMPPPEAKMEMPDSEKAILRQWIEQGAKYESHWAFVAPVKSEPPQVAGAPHPIDAFVREKLAETDFPPSPKADRATLARRASLDLTGLPPSVEEADAFIQDTSPDAWEKYIDRLLASPAYGERWARRWLDLARYADTNGYEKDRPRNIWPWRDWVIRALNADMPFDEFTVKQLAGDMLPNATDEDRIATGFHRNTMLNEEGGIDPLEFRFHAMTDRVATTGTTWLGLTVGCAQCHTHKYDPILHKDYYAMMALLNGADDVAMDLPDAQAEKAREDRQTRLKETLAALPAKWPLPSGMETADWFDTTPSDVHLASSETHSEPHTRTPGPDAGESPAQQDALLVPVNHSADADARPEPAVEPLLRITPEKSILILGESQEKDSYTVLYDLVAQPVDSVRIDALVHPDNPNSGPGKTAHGNFVLSELIVEAQPADQPDAPWEKIDLVEPSATFEQEGYPAKDAIDGKPETGWAIHQPPSGAHHNQHATFRFSKPVAHSNGTRYRVRMDQNYGSHHVLSHFKISFGKRFEDNDPRIAEMERIRTEKYQEEKSKWMNSLLSQTVSWQPLTPAKLESNEPILTVEAENVVFVSGDITKDDTYVLTFTDVPAGLTALRLEALTDPRLPAHGPGMTYYEGTAGDFFLQEIIVTADGQPVKLAAASAAFGDDAKLAIDGDFQSGWSGAGKSGEENQAVFELEQPLGNAAAPVKELRVELRMGRYYASSLGKFRLSATTNPEKGKAKARVLPHGVEAALAKGAQSLTDEEKTALENLFLLTAPQLAGDSAQAKNLLKPVLPLNTLVLRERPAEHMRVTPLRHRGEYTQPKDAILPDVPGFLPPMDPTVEKNRLEFARWLVSPENPLTARVTVNRHWQAFFGTGLVKTMDDFGFQGETPAHQKLLDWLAVHLVEDGWSIKRLHRLIVTSETYQQSSVASAKAREMDPENRFLSFGPRHRVEAEMVRDIALKASGLLSPKMFGPPVRPPQPASVTESSYAGREWNVSQGEDRYRRAIYTFIKRTAPFATYQTFDAPNGEACVARREVSNTPLQSLALLNDEVFFEASRSFAALIVSQTGSVDEKIRFAFRRTVTREPEPQETERIRAFYQTQLSRLQDGSLPTNELGGGEVTPEQAAWTLVARALLNLDETITK